MSKLIAVKTFFNRYEAEQAKGLLDEQSIVSFISADDCGGFDPALALSNGNVRLMVNSNDAAKAQDALLVLEG